MGKNKAMNWKCIYQKHPFTMIFMGMKSNLLPILLQKAGEVI